MESEKGKDGTKIFKMFGAEDGGRNVSVTIPEIPEGYRLWIRNHCSCMDIEKLCEKGEAIQVRLPEIFIPLYAEKPVKKGESNRDLREKPVDIEELIGKNEYLLIEGHPGSGKTTLLKHLAYNLTHSIRVKGLDDFLPVLIFLRDTKYFFEQNEGIKPDAETAEKMVSHYFGSIENILETIKAFCQAKKALFLLDGLDEISPGQREIVVNSFADFRIKYMGNKLVFSGRPHGLEEAAIHKFGDRHIKILSLNMEQVNSFIKKWFSSVYSGDSGIGTKSADGMIHEMQDNPGIDFLKDNPLMLTAICILYHDGKELPGQRAELYKRFIDNLLYKRFKNNSEKVHSFLNTLAFEMHSKGKKGADEISCINTMEKIYKNINTASDEEYRIYLKEQFYDIEPKCGLLKREHGQYSFWHLTFQEFLAARFVADTSKNHIQGIRSYWGNDWYKEVIELYVGYLSINSKGVANEIVEDVVKGKDKTPFKRWLLASKSMIDIHKERRYEEVLDKAKGRLLEIIDADVGPGIRVEAGEILGWLGDTRNMKEFIPVADGEYTLSQGTVAIKAFEIGKYLVTNSWFEEFIKAGGYKNKDYWSEEGKKWLEYTKAEQPALWNDRKWKCPNAPVVGVTWYEAYAFTRWLTHTLNDGYEYRLPDENEWEAAASGHEKRKYSWGNKWDKNRCNNYEIKIGKTSPVGIFKSGNTPNGISDLSGNVWEWTLSDYHSRKILHDYRFDEDVNKLFDSGDVDKYVSKLQEREREIPVVRGGSWGVEGYSCRCAYRDLDVPVYRDYFIGFRCARTLKL
ncbi:MAG: NACHT domain-containing protein [Candidatus Brocadia sp.]|nr:NACHT domain-containing protein [Candidatus Brocadia sp.]